VLFFVAALAGASATDNPHSRFRILQAEARSAAYAGDLHAAEIKYRALLDLADVVSLAPYELYSQVITPLASVLRRQHDSAPLEALYVSRVEQAKPGLSKGLAQADLGFFYQNSEVSVDRYHGTRMVDAAIRTFEECGTHSPDRAQCRKSLFDTAGLQGAIHFQEREYPRAEQLFRRVLAAPESEVQSEVLLVAIHALRGILILKEELQEAGALASRAAAIESKHPNALSRLRNPEGERSRKR
jgi:hypothetical protein